MSFVNIINQYDPQQLLAEIDIGFYAELLKLFETFCARLGAAVEVVCYFMQVGTSGQFNFFGNNGY